MAQTSTEYRAVFFERTRLKSTSHRGKEKNLFEAIIYSLNKTAPVQPKTTKTSENDSSFEHMIDRIVGHKTTPQKTL